MVPCPLAAQVLPDGQELKKNFCLSIHTPENQKKFSLNYHFLPSDQVGLFHRVLQEVQPLL